MIMGILEGINQTEIIMDATAILEMIVDQLPTGILLMTIEPEIKVAETVETLEEMTREVLMVLVEEDTIRDPDIKHAMY